MNLLYVHGLSSSGQSHTVASLKQLLPNEHIVSPDLPLEPQLALQLLHDCVKKYSIDVVIGTSMGGMFAQKLRGYRKILVNPAFHVSQFMRERIGFHEFLNPRQDGVQQFEITSELCDAYAKIEAHQFDHLEPIEQQITFGLFGTCDELINCKPEFVQHYPHVFTFEGGHRLTAAVVEQQILPLIGRLLHQPLP